MILKRIQIKNKSRNVYETLYPLHIVSRMIGLSPYSRRVLDGEMCGYERSTAGNAYSIIFLLLFTTFYQANGVTSRDINHLIGNPVTDKINTFQQNSGISVMAIVILVNMWQQGAVINVIKQIETVDKDLNSMGFFVNYTKKRNMFLGYVIGTILGCICMEYINCNMFLQQIVVLSAAGDFCFLKCMIPMVVNAIIVCQFICYVLLIKERFAMLNGALRDLQTPQVLQKHSQSLAAKLSVETRVKKTLKSVREIHAHLSSISRKINNAYTVQLLLTIALAFIEFATHLYYCFHQIGKLLSQEAAGYFDLSTSICWTFVKLVNISLVALTCDITCIECNKAGVLLFKLENKFETNIGNDVDIFAKQILHYDYKFTACGFFKIDLTLIYTTVCAAVTYLIILLQFELANDQEATKNLLK